MTVELYTSSGWSYTTTVDDSLFSTFLEPYKELEENIRDRIEITGCIAEIVEEGWSTYLELTDVINLSKSSPIRGSGKMNEVHSDTPEFLTCSRLQRSRNEWLKIPSLQSLSRISRILTLPDGWEKYCYTDRTTPQVERFSHILAQGRQMMEVRPGLSIRAFGHYLVDTYGNTFPIRYLLDVAEELLSRVASYTKRGEERNNEKAKINQIFYGFIRNTILKASIEWDMVWNDVIWEDIRVLCDRELSKTMNPHRAATITCDMLGGIGKYKDPNTFDISPRPNDTRGIDAFNTIPDLRGLYHTILSTFTDDVHPGLIGLGRLMMSSNHFDQLPFTTGISISIHYIVKWYNAAVINLYCSMSKRKDLHKDDCVLIIRMMALSFIGREGLRRMLLSLLYLLNHKIIRECRIRIDELAESIEEYLDGEAIEGEGTHPLNYKLFEMSE